MNRGRAAFKEASYEENNESSLRAMRSFTQSIECDLPPVPGLPASLDIDQLGYSDDNSSMKRENTNDTIVEVLMDTGEDRTMGETQKYKMTVPGPGHVEQVCIVRRVRVPYTLSIALSVISGSGTLVITQPDIWKQNFTDPFFAKKSPST
uniref:Unc-41 n=1 Tax=Pristionchus pacificus TaxID=54126 RepID=A0A2A6BRF8_PRIPA|eukprot:PDM68448.1 unc-41 [Pristionchus pacificus]